ncbi:prepilin-type N-terminal cleavage/methylation domain-containing protein [Oxalobacteraceae bacterium]|nr:prepilin-type N-terminal cleavage/methylation domain-containing protein [Oxalobacteraceae bacterium]
MIQRAPLPLPRQRGFTLVEAIIVMVITGVLAGIMVLFIRQPVQNYVDAAGRAEMADVADLALRRMARELRGALPNSLRVIGSASGGSAVTLIEFIPTKTGGTYLSVEDNNGTPVLDFQNTANKTFTVTGTMPVFPYNIAANDYIVVYNLGTGFTDADAYAGNNRAQVSGAPVGNVVTIAANPFAVPANAIPARVPNTSPTQRFNVVGTPVTFRCVNSAAGTGTLTRLSTYGYSASQIDPAAAAGVTSALLANNVVGCNFNVTSLANTHLGLIGLDLALARPGSSSERVMLSHQIHVENTP